MINAFAIALLAALPQQTATSDLSRVLDPALSDLVERHRLPGLAIGVVKDGETIYARGFGETSRGSGRPITTQSLFHMASVSKPFTATAVMQLVEAGKMKLDAPLTKYLPYFRLDDERYEVITVRQVLTHTSGIPDVEDWEWDKPQTDEGAAERYVRSLTGERLIFAPGEGWSYSDIAFDIMGDVIAKVSGMPFEDYVRAHILEPLGMTSSSFIHSETPKEHRTQPHSLAYSERIDVAPCPVYPYNRRHAPSSNLDSSVDDMCRWALANLAWGELDGKRILARESYVEMWSRDDDTPTIGLSWFLDDFMGLTSVSHSGGDMGFRSFLKLVPDEKLGVILIVNSDVTPLLAVADAALRAAMGEEFSLPDARISVEFAHVLEHEGLEAAIERYAELEETEPDRWNFSFGELDLVCEALSAKERHAEVVEVAALNADLYFDFAAAHRRLGHALVAAGDLDGARESFEFALSLSPGDRASRVALRALDQ